MKNEIIQMYQQGTLTMAALNEQQRVKLAEELRGMKFRQATGKLRRMDVKGRLAYFRNVQVSGKVYTRYVLPSLGVQVTLVEEDVRKAGPSEGRLKQEFELVDVLVEPLS